MSAGLTVTNLTDIVADVAIFIPPIGEEGCIGAAVLVAGAGAVGVGEAVCAEATVAKADMTREPKKRTFFMIIPK